MESSPMTVEWGDHLLQENGDQSLYGQPGYIYSLCGVHELLNWEANFKVGSQAVKPLGYLMKKKGKTGSDQGIWESHGESEIRGKTSSQ
jgi:hypothetical protein